MDGKEKGFTLIELSIVLVIIGLVAGGILFGRSLIRASELRSVVSDIGSFEAAQMTFRNKYNCIAGDCKHADSFGIGNNGDGSGYVEHYGYNVESYQFWQHLANAQLIGGSYSGTGNSTPVLGENIPSSRISGVGYSIFTPAPVHLVWSPNQDSKGLPRSVYDTMYIVGRAGVQLTYGGFISPIEAKALDIKSDDGKANDGHIRTIAGYAPYNTLGCTVGSSPDYSYSTDENSLCSLSYWLRNF